MATEVAKYSSESDMQRGVERMSQQGWRVVSTTSYTPRKGCLRTVAGGFLFFNRKPVHQVTFQK